MSTFAQTMRRVIRRSEAGETALEPGVAVPSEAAAIVQATP